MNKKFLESTYPRGRAIGVFRWFHFDLKDQKPKFYILDTRFLEDDGLLHLGAEPRRILSINQTSSNLLD